MTTPPFPMVKEDYFTGLIPARIIRRMEIHDQLSGAVEGMAHTPTYPRAELSRARRHA